MNIFNKKKAVEKAPRLSTVEEIGRQIKELTDSALISLNSISNNDSLSCKLTPPIFSKNVVPKNRSAPVLAMDNECYGSNFLGQNIQGFKPFPGFPQLANLTTIAEYRQFADVNATELTREWITLGCSDTEDKASVEKIKIIEEKLNELNVRDVVREAATHVDFYGRAQILMTIDGNDLDKPLVLSNKTIKKGSFSGVKTIEPFWTTPVSYESTNPASKYFYNPRKWFVVGQEIDSSRLLTIVTRPVADVIKPAYNFAGVSLSQLAIPYVDNWLRTRQAVADLVNNFSVLSLKTNMSTILAGDEVVAMSLIDRIKLFTKCRSNGGLMMLDKDTEELEQLAVPLSGLSDLQSQTQEHLCTVSGIPAVKLLGVSPSGFNATADGEIRAFYDKKSAEQEAYWRKPIQDIINVIMVSELGEVDKSITFKFNPLWQMDSKERADIQEAEARTNSIYINDGVMSSSEVREKLSSDEESGYDGLDTDVMNEIDDFDNDEVDELPQVESEEQ